MNKKILIITQYYFPEPIPFCHDFALECKRLGYEVDVLTSWPIYPSGILPNKYKNKLICQEKIDGVNVTRVWQYSDHSKNAIKRSLNYLSFMVSVLLLGNFNFKKYQFVFLYQSAIPTGIAAKIFARIRNIPLICFVPDLWPESVISSTMVKNKYIIKIIDKLCDFVYKKNDLIVGVTEGFNAKFKKIGIPDERIHLTYYWPPKDIAVSEEFSFKFDKKRKLNVLFAGNMGPFQDLLAILKAAQLIKETENDIHFHFVGDGLYFSELVLFKNENNLNNVTFYGRKPYSEMNDYFRSSDLLLVHLKKDPLSVVSIPSKTWPYILSKKPVLMAVEGVATDLFKEHKLGFTCEPSNVVKLADKFIEISTTSKSDINVFTENAIEFYNKKVDKKSQVPELLTKINDICF